MNIAEYILKKKLISNVFLIRQPLSWSELSRSTNKGFVFLFFLRFLILIKNSFRFLSTEQRGFKCEHETRKYLLCVIRDSGDGFFENAIGGMTIVVSKQIDLNVLWYPCCAFGRTFFSVERTEGSRWVET